jgi:hypothetical protein
MGQWAANKALVEWKLFNSAQAFEGEILTRFMAQRLSLRGIKR